MSRRTLVLLVCAAVAVVLLYGGAVVAGANRSGSSPDDVSAWSERLQGFGGEEVPAEDLLVRPPCGLLADRSVEVSGSCLLSVPAAGGFPLSGLSRRLTLHGRAGSVRLETSVRDEPVTDDLGPGDGGRLAFARDPVEVRLTCLSLPPCAVTLGE